MIYGSMAVGVTVLREELFRLRDYDEVDRPDVPPAVCRCGEQKPEEHPEWNVCPICMRGWTTSNAKPVVVACIEGTNPLMEGLLHSLIGGPFEVSEVVFDPWSNFYEHVFDSIQMYHKEKMPSLTGVDEGPILPWASMDENFFYFISGEDITKFISGEDITKMTLDEMKEEVFRVRKFVESHGIKVHSAGVIFEKD